MPPWNPKLPRVFFYKWGFVDILFPAPPNRLYRLACRRRSIRLSRQGAQGALTLFGVLTQFVNEAQDT
jgi:hypothetical protein